jgi:hypothetical protein
MVLLVGVIFMQGGNTVTRRHEIVHAISEHIHDLQTLEWEPRPPTSHTSNTHRTPDAPDTTHSCPSPLLPPRPVVASPRRLHRVETHVDLLPMSRRRVQMGGVTDTVPLTFGEIASVDDFWDWTEHAFAPTLGRLTILEPILASMSRS